MPKRGKCALCHQPGLLQRSHLIGRAMYRMSREKGFDPVVLTPRLATHTQKQIKEYMFCEMCEDLFNKGGEKYVTSLVYDGQHFPLLDRIRLAPLAGRQVSPEGLWLYSGKKLGIDADKLAYYAISVVWRASIAQWKTLGNQRATVAMDEKRQEQLRRYLLGHIKLPHDAGVVVTVCTDPESQGWVFLPTRVKREEFTGHALLVRGIAFRVFVDVAGRFPLHESCCVRSSENLIWVKSCVEDTKNSFKDITSMAKIAENLKRRTITSSRE